MQKLLLKQDSHATAPYKIVKIENSIAFDVNERLTKIEVLRLLELRVANQPLWSITVK